MSLDIPAQIARSHRVLNLLPLSSDHLQGGAVATFARRLTGGRWRISVRGELRAADLRRLERACAPALEQCPMPLDIDVDTLQAVDEPSRRFVVCLLHRGAALVGASRNRWQAAMGEPT